MGSFWVKICLSLVVFAITGCASTLTMEESEFPRNGWDIQIIADQNEIEIDEQSTNPGTAGGGLLGVLIVHAMDSSANNRAEDAVTQIRDQLARYQISEVFSERLKESGVLQRLSTNSEVTIAREAIPSDTLADNNTIRVMPRVLFSNDLSTLLVRLRVWEGELGSDGKLDSTGAVFNYESFASIPEPDVGDKREHFAEAWVNKEVGLIIEMIEDGMDRTIAMLERHLLEPSPVLSSNNVKLPQNRPFRVKEWRREDGWVWAMNSTGKLYAAAVPEELVDSR